MTMKKSLLVLGAVVGLFALGWFLWKRPRVPDYDVTYLSMPATFWSTAVAVNDQGQVTGNADMGKGFLWDAENGITEWAEGHGESWHFTDINNKGQIVGGISLEGDNSDSALHSHAKK